MPTISLSGWQFSTIHETGLYICSIAMLPRNLNNFNFSRHSISLTFVSFCAPQNNRMLQLPDGDNTYLVLFNTQSWDDREYNEERRKDQQQQQKQRWKIIMLWGSICMIISLCRVVTINNTQTPISFLPLI